jgi:hypothetical protein
MPEETLRVSTTVTLSPNLHAAADAVPYVPLW